MKRSVMVGLGAFVTLTLLTGVALARANSLTLVAPRQLLRGLGGVLIERPMPAPPSKVDREQGRVPEPATSRTGLIEATGMQNAISGTPVTIVLPTGMPRELKMLRFRDPKGRVYLTPESGGLPGQAGYSSDLKSYVFEADGQVFLVDAASLSVETITPDAIAGLDRAALLHEQASKSFPEQLYWAANPSISPDGRYVAYFSNRRTFSLALHSDQVTITNDLWVYDRNLRTSTLLVEDTVGTVLHWVDQTKFAYTNIPLRTEGWSDVFVFDLTSNTSKHIASHVEVQGAGGQGFLTVVRDASQRLHIQTYDWNGQALGTWETENLVSEARYSANGRMGFAVIEGGLTEIVIADPTFQHVTMAPLPTGHSLEDLAGWFGDKFIVVTRANNSSEGSTWALEADN